MNQFGQYLKKFMEERDLKLEYFGEKIGVSFASIGHYINGRRSPSYKFLEKFFKAFNIDVEEQKRITQMVELDKMPEDMKRIKKMSGEQGRTEKLPAESNARILINEEFIDIPVRAKASAGNGYINLDECLYTMRIRKNGYHKDCYLIEVAGTSMSPLIEDGAFVIVDPHQTEYIKDKVYIVNYNEETYVKKVEINQDAGIMILKSVNPNYDSVYIPKGDSHLVKIMGRAVSFFYEGKL